MNELSKEITRQRKSILKRSNEILQTKARINKYLSRALDEQMTLTILEKDMLNMQLKLDGLRAKEKA